MLLILGLHYSLIIFKDQVTLFIQMRDPEHPVIAQIVGVQSPVFQEPLRS